MEVIDCDLSWAGNGIYNISNTNNSPSYYLFKGNRIYNIGVRSTTRNSDAHAIGIQGGIGGTIEDNVCFKAGSGITLYAFTNQVLRNTTVRRNKIYDTHTLGGANSFGIETSCDNDSLSDKSGNLFYQNIIFNTSKGFKLQFEDTQEVYNNIIYNCQVGLFAARSYNGYGPSIKARNNIICNSGSNHIYYGTSGTTALLDSDHNLFYPDGPAKFWFNGAATNLAGWQSMTKAGFTLDPDSEAVDPLFIAASNSNFHLQDDSPGIDAGISVGLTKDIDGVSIPQGAGPDIGGYEFVFDSNTLNATASASPSSGSSPLNVAFTCTASGGASPYSYRWTFGDGGNSTIQNPSHTYSSIGSYSATVTVTDSTSATATSQVNINVTGAVPLSANIAASPTSGQAPLAVNFTGSASGGTSPYSYRWSFGDGSNSTTQNPSHTYSSAGSFAATLTVTDSLSANASSTVAITVNSVLPQFTASATATPTSGQAPLAVSFTGAASGGTSPYSFNWDFGDGNSSTSQNPSYTYLSVGTYTATLTVTDSVSASANSSVSIIVGSTSSANLALAAQTGAPSPGEGGTTSPAPGTYNYAVGSDVDVSSIPNTNYRFSKWDGDISLTWAFDSATSLILDTSKSLTSTFCTKCADANGDLAITPADAQTAFDIFLGKIAQPTWCEKENADVNCSGTKLEPKVTPADAQMIFRKYIKKENLSGDCSGNSRTSAFPFETVGSFGSVGQVVLANVQAVRGDIIALPVFIDGLKEVTSFGFDLSFPSGSLTFMGLEKTDLTGDYAQLDGNVLADPAGPMDQDGQASEQESILRVGGFKLESNGSAASGVLVTLIFRAERDISEPQLLTVIALYDEIQNIMIPGSSPTLRSDRFDERQARDPENIDRGKRYDF
jgi:PKD repeat protein